MYAQNSMLGVFSMFKAEELVSVVYLGCAYVVKDALRVYHPLVSENNFCIMEKRHKYYK